MSVSARTGSVSRGRRLASALGLGALAAGGALRPAALQGQAGTELRGQVTAGGRPVPGARVQVTAEGGTTVQVLADPAGRYRVRFPADGPYVVAVHAAGLAGASRVLSGVELAGPGTRSADFELTERTVALAALAVRVQPLSVAGATRNVPGSREQARLGITLRDEPLTGDLLADIAARASGVAASDGGGLSISGQPADQTRVTMDGADALSIAVPREAVRAVNLLTSTYDVGRGRFTGGMLDVQTLRGGDEWGGSARAAAAGSALEYGRGPGVDGSSHLSLDAGGGGPLARGRLFGYGAVSARRTESRTRWLPQLREGALRRLGLDPDSVARFLAVTGPARPAPDGPGGAASRFVSGLGRLDAVLTPRHSLMLRFAGQTSSVSDPDRTLSLPGTGTRIGQDAAGALVQLSSTGRHLANELRASLGASWRGGDAADPVPTGVLLAGSGAQDQALRFAGSPFMPARARERTWELADQAVARTADQRHRFRLGAEVAGHAYERDAPVDPGTFTFESLGDLSANRPSHFTRSFSAGALRAASYRAAVFVDDTWTPGALQLSYGLRAERSWTDAVERDPAVVERFGPGGGEVPSPWRVSPRVGFGLTTRMPWDRGPGGRTSLYGGVGHFAGGLPLPALHALGETGRPEAADLVCVGAAVPAPDWDAYRRAPGSVPDTCAGGGQPLPARLPRTTLFAPAFSPPAVWRASLGGQGVLASGLLWNVSAAVLRGVRQPLAFDRNLRAEPQFFNESEAGRPVYTAPDAIDAVTGLPALAASRLHPELGVVREATSLGASRTVQLSANLSQVFFTRRAGWAHVDAGYTWTAGSERSGGIPAPGGGFATTGGDPDEVEWTPASYSPRHIAQLYGGLNPSPRLWLGLIGTLSSGRPFTPLASGDVNGDGVQNDRAFIFGPESAADAAVAEGMARLLRELPRGARACLRRQPGTVAAQGSCRTGWSGTLDLNARYAFGPRIDATHSRRATLWLVAANVPGGLDYLLHGSSGLRGWGQPAAVDPVLLRVRGFDPVSRRFRYELNPGFGRPGGTSRLLRAPFSLSVQVRVVLGTDRALKDFRNRMAAGQVNAAAFTPASIRAHAVRQLPNVPAEILAVNLEARLLLTPSQARQLEAAAGELEPRIAALAAAVTAAVAHTGPPAPLPAERAAELTRQGQQLRAEAVQRASAILSPQQWSRVPPRLRDPQPPFSPHPPQELSGTPDY